MLGVVSFGTFIWTVARTKPHISFTVPRVFHILLLAFITVRLTWVCIKTLTEETDVTYALNRTAFSFYFSSFVLVVFQWAEIYHKNYIESIDERARPFLPRLRWVFLFVITLIWVCQIGFVATKLAMDYNEGDAVYETNVLVDAFASLVVSILFAIYGVLLLMHRKAEVAEIWGGALDVGGILGITLAFVVCFLLRVAMYLYRPITGDYLPDAAFVTCAYYVPEIVPSLLQIYIVQTSKHKLRLEAEFIDNLYAEAEEETSKRYFGRGGVGGEEEEDGLYDHLRTETSDLLLTPPSAALYTTFE
ncbi:hypothetical protein QOT17_019579 [Balamuthia mandrillaris]